MNTFLEKLNGSCERPSFVVSRSPVTNEKDVEVCCRNNIFDQLHKLTELEGWGRFGSSNEFNGQLDTKVAFVDRVFWSGSSTTKYKATLLIEIKPPWYFDSVEDIIQLYNTSQEFRDGSMGDRSPSATIAAIMGSIRQLAGYLSFSSLRFGVLLTYNCCWVVQRDVTEPGHLMISPAISRESMSPSLFEAIVYAIWLSIQNPSCPPIPPSPPPSPGQSTDDDHTKDLPPSSGDEFCPPPSKKPRIFSKRPITRSQSSSATDIIDLDRCELDIENVIGEGSLGVVVAARINGEPVTLKIVDMIQNPSGGNILQGEYDKYLKMSHLQGSVLSRVFGLGNLWNLFLCLIMEPAAKCIHSPLTSIDKEQMLSCLRHLHDDGMRHGDIEMRHFLKREDGTIFLIDLDRAESASRTKLTREWNSLLHLLNSH
jgi:hypothetical protein